MRSKVFVPLLIIGGLLVALLFFIHERGGQTSPGKLQIATEKRIEASPPESPKRTLKAPAADDSSSSHQNREQAASNSGATPEEQHDAYVEKRTEELMDLAMAEDSDSLNTILSELTNRDPQIRKAALEACIQFGSRDAIPKLSDVVSQTDDPKEKAEIVEAIEFLKLPSATEVIAQAGGVKNVRQKSRKP
jgi:hypothetical protein